MASPTSETISLLHDCFLFSNTCDSHKYTQLPLVPVEQFLEQKPEFAEANDTNDDEYEHQLIDGSDKARAGRTRGAGGSASGTIKEKQSLIAFNKKRKDDLASLDNDLEKFIDVSRVNWISCLNSNVTQAAKPIQKISKRSIEDALSSWFPQPHGQSSRSYSGLCRLARSLV